MTKIIFKIHLFVLAIGFIVGFGFVPEVRTELSNIMSDMIPKRETRPEPVPNRHEFVPEPVAILPKTKTKQNGRV